MLTNKSIHERGFAIVPNLVSSELRRGLLALFQTVERKAGQRNALAFEPVQAAAGSEAVAAIVRTVLGGGAFAVKATLFDKTRASNWLVPWHQDLMIPLQEKRDTPGFDAWSTKAGIPHVRPPARVLESMLAIRLDLDGSTQTTGPLRVIPGTHKLGIIGADRLQKLQQTNSHVECLVPPSGGVVMRPLLLHASSRASAPTNRRIVHLEFASDSLPTGLNWFRQNPICKPSDSPTDQH